VAACSSQPAASAPPALQTALSPAPGNHLVVGGHQRIGLDAMANTGICYFLRDDGPHRDTHPAVDPPDHRIRATVARPGWGERIPRAQPPVTLHICDS
jgi:hypothetical protein